MRIPLTSGTFTRDSRWMGRVRFLRAGLVTPLSGGPGIVSAGTTTGARGQRLSAADGAGNACALLVA